MCETTSDDGEESVFEIEQRGLDGNDPVGQTTFDGTIVREGGEM